MTERTPTGYYPILVASAIARLRYFRQWDDHVQPLAWDYYPSANKVIAELVRAGHLDPQDTTAFQRVRQAYRQSQIVYLVKRSL